jgi:cytidine deaminase
LDFFSLKNDEKITITSQFSAYNSLQGLPTDIQDLMEQAVAVRKRLCPLFKIRVGVTLY